MISRLTTSLPYLIIPCLILGFASEGIAKKKKKRRGGGKYPLKVNARPLVLPKGMGEANAALGLTSFTVGKKSTNAIGLTGGFNYGVSKGIEVGGATGFNLSPEAGWGSSFNLRGGYRVIKRKKRGLNIAARLEVPLSFGEDQDLLSNASAGMSTRYRINKKLALHSGDNLLSFTFGEEVTTRINVPIGVAYQVNRRLNVRFDTQIISLGSGGTLSVDKSLPIFLRGIYAIKRVMDVGVSLSADPVSEGPLSISALFAYRVR